MHTWPTKDPDEVLDYQFNWADRLVVGETIVTSVFIRLQGDVVVGDDDIAGDVTSVWLSGGTAGTNNIITNRIVTSAARTYDESATLRIRTK